MQISIKNNPSYAYKQGYGDRIKVEIPEPLKKDIEIKNVEFPLYIFPIDLQIYIKQSEEKLMLNAEIMASSLLWLTSVIIGNSFKVKQRSGVCQGKPYSTKVLS